jgi:predicted secreted Zn-dependent protease
MGGGRKPGPIGLDPSETGPGRIGGGFSDPGPIGDDEPEEPEELAGAIPTVGDVQRVWSAASRRTTPEIEAHGATLADVKASLDGSQGPHWGEGGGELTMDQITGVKRGEKFTITLRGTLINRIPKWVERDKASAAAGAEWDRFIAKLKAHEECHVAIALKAFEKLADAYPGKKITDVDQMFLDAKKQLKKDQDELDSTTQNGQKTGDACGDALLNTAIK